MLLLENIRGAKTSDETLATCTAVGAQIKKWPVLSENSNGFIGNRMLQYYSQEAQEMIQEGASPMQIDQAAKNFGMRMGPIAM